MSYLVSGRSRAVRTAYVEAEAGGARIALSTVTEAEVLFGLEQKPQATRLRAAIETFFTTVELLSWDSSAAHAYSKLRSHLRATGSNLSLMDLLIASQAVASGATLVSHDKAFQAVGSILPTVDWATDL